MMRSRLISPSSISLATLTLCRRGTHIYIHTLSPIYLLPHFQFPSTIRTSPSLIFHCPFPTHFQSVSTHNSVLPLSPLFLFKSQFTSPLLLHVPRIHSSSSSSIRCHTPSATPTPVFPFLLSPSLPLHRLDPVRLAKSSRVVFTIAGASSCRLEKGGVRGRRAGAWWCCWRRW